MEFHFSWNDKEQKYRRIKQEQAINNLYGNGYVFFSAIPSINIYEMLFNNLRI